MSDFIQLHLLTSYAPSNLNRDELGRPKTATFGNCQRLRVSSQSLKRAWRTSDVFLGKLGGPAEFLDERREPKAAGVSVGLRTKDIGNYAYNRLSAKLSPKDADALAKKITAEFGEPKAEKNNDAKAQRQTEQLAHISIEEKAAVDAIIARVLKGESIDDKEIGGLVRSGKGTPDIALFGRMLAAKPQFNIEAACQVAHALSVHKVTVEDDYFSAVDDLNKGDEDKGAGHIGTAEFAAAVFYLYICIDRSLLLANLNGQEDLCQKTLEGLIEACCKVSPRGKQNSHASRERAHFLLVERGDNQPRSLSVAFLKPITSDNVLEDAIGKIKNTRENMEKAYGEATAFQAINFLDPGGATLQTLVKFASGARKVGG